MRLVYQIQISPKRISGSTVAESPNKDHNRVESDPKVNREDLSFSQKLSGFADDNIGDAIGHRVQSLDSYKRRLHSYKTREDIAMELVFKPVTQQDSDTRINTALDTKENSAKSPFRNGLRNIATILISNIHKLVSIRINSLLLESLATTCPSESLSQRLRDLSELKVPPISSNKLKAELCFLSQHHMQSEFESSMSTSTKDETHGPLDLGITDMKHLIKRPSNASANSEINQPSPMVLVEEFRFQWDIPHYPEIDDLGHAQSPGHENHPTSKSLEHRKAVLNSFDWRNKILLELEEPPFLATVATAKSIMKQLLDPEIEEHCIEGFWSSEVVQLVDTYKLLRDDQTCGLRLLYDQAIDEKNRHAPTDRIDCIRWVFYYNPIMTQALELAYKYCRDDKERLVVYVEEPWIQFIAVALFVVAGFNVGSIRSSDTGEEQFKTMDQWKNKASGLEILVANVNTKVRDVNAHTDCTKGLLLNWTLEPARMLKMINNMGSTNQKKQSIFHMLKVADTYHDVIERVCCTKWAMQLSKDIKLPEWMTGVVREICIFELIKSTWHQQFNRYACVVACDLKGHDFEYHDPEWCQLGHVFSIAAKLMLHHPEDKDFWVESMPILMELCFHFKDAFDKSDGLECRLSLTPKEMRKLFLPIFKGMKNTRNLKPARDCTNNFPSPNIRLFPPSHLSLHIRFRTLHRKTPIPDHQSMRPSEPERYIRSRIANACDGCKSRKVKCDGKLPCSYCTRRQKPHDCHYSPQRRRKAHSVRSPQTSERAQSTRHTTPSTPAAEPVRENGAQIDRDDGGQIDAEDETEVPREARLVCDAQGKLIFVGDCAPLSFFQSVRQLVTTRVGQNAFAPQSSRYSVLENATAHQSRRIPGDNRIPIVHPDDIPPAVSNYLSIATGLVDLFDNRRLQDDLILWANMDQKQDDATTIVNFLVLAIGTKINDEERSQDYFEYARDKAYSNLTGNLSVSTVQMFTLITLYMLCSCQINGAFLFFGTAVRAAYSIGIHRTEVNARFGPDIHRQRDRLWKSIRVVDLFLSSSMGRPPATSDVDCTVPYQSPDENVEEPVDLLNASVQIFLVLEGVVTEIYSRRKVSLQLTEGISLQLRDWSSRWLKQLKDIVANPEAQDRAQASGACQILATYYYAVMLVSRPFLMYELCRRLSDGSLNSNGRSALTSGKSKLADACIDAASLMVDPILDLIQKGILVGHVPILVSWLFASSLVLGVGLLGGFGRVLEKYTRMAIHALDHCSKHDTHAGQYSLIAQSLLTTALEYLEKRELAERQRRTENSSQLFGLIPSDTMDSSPTFTGQSMTTPSSRGRESLDRTFLQHNGLQHVGSPLFGDLDSAFLGLSESMMQTPDPSYWGGPMGNEADSGSALNLFALLDAGGGIDLTHHL
ncbi:uncharacterized protein FOBCDRAFT_239395 [Fusarium oxysporum Fo47]|nr:uncharacterized protein FOBCDRAFT_239395 [Fusarium oxysporum Fo47]WJG35222.1 hypothetical protein FOBCDRAFT_239395 [Fusarium oxysporum Fo47]